MRGTTARIAARPLAVALALPIALGAGAALAAEGSGTESFARFDANEDGTVSRDEFVAGMKREGAFSSFDTDRSARVDERELRSGVFRYLDQNDDGALEPAEYREGWRTWFPSEPPMLEAIDADNDGVVDEEEFEAASTDLGLYQQDVGEAYGTVTEEEFYAGIYDSWDVNADERLAEDEWFVDDEQRWPLGD